MDKKKKGKDQTLGIVSWRTSLRGDQVLPGPSGGLSIYVQCGPQ